VTIDQVLESLNVAVTEKKEKIAYLDRQMNNISVEENMLNHELEQLQVQQKEYDSKRVELVSQLQQEIHEKQASVT
jgi:predicted transcriptional regulator